MHAFRKIFTIILCSAFAVSGLQAQKQRTIAGTVLDGHTGQPVKGAEVRCGNLNRKSDYYGRFTLDLTRGEQLVIIHVNYQTRKISYRELRERDDITIYISHHSNHKANVSVSEKAELVLDAEFESVLDFVFLGDTLVMLHFMESRPQINESGMRYLRNTLNIYVRGKHEHRIILPDHVEGLYLDPFERLFVAGKDFTLQVHRTAEEIFTEKVSNDYFSDRIRTIAAIRQNQGYFAVSASPIPELTHFVVTGELEDGKAFRRIRNKEYFDHVPGDYAALTPWQQKRAEELSEKTGIDAKLFAPILRERWHDKPFEFPYAPSFSKDDRLFIFDHMNGWLYHHNMKGLPTDSVSIFHHKFEGEKYRGMIQDDETKRVFSVHEKAGAVYIREINPATGAARKPFKLSYPFPYSIRMHNGWVYFNARLPGAREFYKLYREKFPY